MLTLRRGITLDKCFVAQPFDKGKFDKRFDEIFQPAILDAGLEPYRVDRDDSVVIAIDKIHEEILNSRVCLVDITTDNPNVWYELGYAIASNKHVVMICSKERTTPFPFDVSHRMIIPYNNDSVSDFENLRKKITAAIKSRLLKEETINSIEPIETTSTVNGLDRIQIASLIAIAQELNGPVSARALTADMERSGYTRGATMYGVRSLLKLGFVEEYVQVDLDGPYRLFQASESGVNWLLENKEVISFQKPNDDLNQLDERDFPF